MGKPAVQIKVAIEEDKPKRLRKKQESFDAEANKLFSGPEPAKVEPPPPPKPEPVPEEEESEEEEEEVKPLPKKLSKADLKPAVQIKMNIAPEEKPALRRKPKRQDTVEQEGLFDNVPAAKPKVKDEFAEKDKKPKPEDEEIVITPKDLPEKPEEPLKEKDKVRDEFAERDKKPKLEEEKIIITPAVLPTKPEVKAP